MKRITGLLVLEVRDSNPNGDPDRESRPRLRDDGKGEISPVSVKRKIRDLVENKEGPVWKELGSELRPADYEVFERRERDWKLIAKESQETFKQKYWDARLFGNTFLESGKTDCVRTGVAQFGIGISVAPISIKELTLTKKAGAQEGKDRGMAPLGFKVVEHAIYTVPFFVNPSAAEKSGCTEQDVDLMLKILPHCYNHTRSFVRSQVEVLAVHTFIHSNPLGSVSDLKFIDMLTPKKIAEPSRPSISNSEYSFPTFAEFSQEFEGKGIYKNFALQ